MREPLTTDDIEGLEAWARTPAQHRESARRLVGWAAESHPADDPEATPASLLVSAGWHLEQADDVPGALDLYRRAVTAEGPALPDARCYLHAALVKTGDTAAEREVAEEIRRSRPQDPEVYAFMTEDYELAGDLAAANRWANIGLRVLLGLAEEDEEAWDDVGAVSLLNARARVREGLGFPPDEWDERAHSGRGF